LMKYQFLPPSIQTLFPFFSTLPERPLSLFANIPSFTPDNPLPFFQTPIVFPPHPTSPERVNRVDKAPLSSWCVPPPFSVFLHAPYIFFQYGRCFCCIPSLQQLIAFSNLLKSFFLSAIEVSSVFPQGMQACVEVTRRAFFSHVLEIQVPAFWDREQETRLDQRRSAANVPPL